MIGREVGSYRIAEKLGEGGMGAVYRAEHATLGKRVAIKVLLPEYSHNQDLVDRFFNEAKAATAIDHPGIVEVFDFGHAGDASAYIVMEYLEGEDLGKRLARLGRLSVDEAIAIGKMVAGALESAHVGGIVHRDLKPDNVLMVSDPDVPGGERAKVLDFGIAKLLDVPEERKVKTRTGTLMGTPAYMSPEQCRGYGAIDARSDIYSLGCVLYHLLVGHPPFPHPGTGEVLAAHLHQPAPRARESDPSIPKWLDELLLWMLSKEPGARPETMARVAEALRRRELPEGRATAPGNRRARAASAPALTPAPLDHGAGAARTTLSGAAGQSSGTPARRGGARALLFVAAASGVAVLVVAGLVGASALFGDEEPTIAEVERDAVPAVGALDDAAAPAKTETAAAPAAPKVTFEITSEPDQAQVYRKPDHVQVGTTPVSLEVTPTDGRASFLVEKEGFAGREVDFDASRGGTEHVVLAAAPRLPEKTHRTRRARHGKSREGRSKLIKDGALDPYAN